MEKKFIARITMGSSDETQMRFDDVNRAIGWLGACEHATGMVYRVSTDRAIYQIERGKVNFDRRMKREKA
jgi:elongation factor P hydroxylase